MQNVQEIQADHNEALQVEGVLLAYTVICLLLTGWRLAGADRRSA